MNRSVALLLLASFAASSAYAECNYPKAPGTIPDGKTAALEDMLAANKAVKAYNADMETYLGCIKKEAEESIARQNETLSEDQKKQMAAVWQQRNNAAVDELESVAARLNEQIRVYKAAHPSK
jgi:hypothetical protein